MKTIQFKSTLAAVITASTLITTGVAPMNAAHAESLLLPGGLTFCQKHPGACLPSGPTIAPPPIAPVPPAPPTPSGGLTDGQKVGLGILGALAVGAVVANSRRGSPSQGLSQAHYAYCDGKYQTFDPATNSFMSNAGYRKPCMSPYMH